MRVGILRVEFHSPDARSLKAKRGPVKSLVERLQNRFRCAVAEVDHQDLHQRVALGIALVASDGEQLNRQLQSVRQYVEANAEMAVLDIQIETHSGPEGFHTFRLAEYEED